MELHAEKESPGIKSQQLLEAKMFAQQAAKPVKQTIQPQKQHEEQFQQPKGHEGRNTTKECRKV